MKLMNTFKIMIVVILGFSIIACEKEEERTVTAGEVPQNVLKAFNETYPGATIKEYAEETEDGQKFYEISCEFEGRKIDASYKPDGTVAAIEEVIAVEQLPENIHQAIAKEFQQFSIQLAEKIEKEGKQFFEVKLLDTKDQKKYELKFSDTGKLVEKEVKKSEEKEEAEEKAEEAEGEREETAMKITVPEEVAAAFQTKFAAATEIEWGKESATEFEAEFKLDGKKMSANFDATGKWLETEAILSAEELPAPVLRTLKAQFGEYQVKKVESLEKASEPMTFEVKLEKGETILEVVLDASGKVVKQKIKEEVEEKEPEDAEKE
jgi:hypothetical protein